MEKSLVIFQPGKVWKKVFWSVSVSIKKISRLGRLTHMIMFYSDTLDKLIILSLVLAFSDCT